MLGWVRFTKILQRYLSEKFRPHQHNNIRSWARVERPFGMRDLRRVKGDVGAGAGAGYADEAERASRELFSIPFRKLLAKSERRKRRARALLFKQVPLVAERRQKGSEEDEGENRRGRESER